MTVYTHVSDPTSSAPSARAPGAISCSPREAIYVLDGLLENDALLRPREHYTDTHGFTEQLFGLCDLLGDLVHAALEGPRARRSRNTGDVGRCRQGRRCPRPWSNASELVTELDQERPAGELGRGGESRRAPSRSRAPARRRARCRASSYGSVDSRGSSAAHSTAT
jgi:hypothetical protein